MGIVYGIILFILLIELVLIPSKEEKNNFLTRVSIGIVAIMALNILAALLFFIFKIKLFIGIIFLNLVIEIFLTIYLIKRKKIQKYEIKICDIVFVIVLMVAITIIAVMNYGIPLEIKYDTTDASTHFIAAVEMIRENRILINTENNFFANIDFDHLLIGAYVNSGIFFEIFGEDLEDIDIYKLYIYFDMFMLFISGIIMYVAISEISKKQIIKYIGAIVAVIYTLGYPLNSVVMGSSYLTLSLIFAAAIVLICNEKEKISSIHFRVMLFLFNLGLVHSYILFGIVVLLSEIIFCILRGKKKAIKTILLCIILPLITWVIYTNNSQDKINMIKEEGPMYKNYYSNFIIYIPFIIYSIYIKVKNREKIDFSTVLFGIMIIILPIAYILKNEQIISSYYYSKFYYLLWIPVLILFAKSIYIIYEKRKLAVYIIAGILAVLFVTSYIFDDTKYNGEEILQDISKEKITTVSQIFKINANFINDERKILNEEEIEIVKYLKKTVNLKENKAEVIGTLAQLNWVYVFYNYSDSESNKDETTRQLYEKLHNVENVNTKYIIYFKKSNLWKAIKTELREKYYYIYITEWGGIMQKND